MPAFTAGVELLRRLDVHRASFVRTIDDLAQPLLVASEMGQTLHCTPALTALLARDPDGARLLRETARTAGMLARAGRGGGTIGGASLDGVARVSQEIETHVARYSLRASFAGSELLGAAPVVLVLVERLTPTPPSLDALGERYALTRSQARVALLMAEGKSHAQVAAALQVSVHTARRHAEAVRAKLGAHRAAEVAAAVLGQRAPAPTGGHGRS